MEEDALLHRRERVDVLEGAAHADGARRAVDGRGERREREVGRRVAPGVGREAVRDERAERGEEAARERLDGRAAVAGLAVGEAQVEAAAEDAAGARRGGGAGTARRCAAGRRARARAERRVAGTAGWSSWPR